MAFEVISRRMQQVARALWRRCFRCASPDDMGPFGEIGVFPMGDFAQLPPVLSTSLMAGMQIIESGGPSAHSMTLAGRQTFNTFDEVTRLRRIHRQKGADAFKDSTIRLRDAANTVNGGTCARRLYLFLRTQLPGRSMTSNWLPEHR